MISKHKPPPVFVSISPGQAYLWHATRLRNAIIGAANPAKAYKDAMKELGLAVIETKAGPLLISTE